MAIKINADLFINHRNSYGMFNKAFEALSAKTSEGKFARESRHYAAPSPCSRSYRLSPTLRPPNPDVLVPYRCATGLCIRSWRSADPNGNGVCSLAGKSNYPKGTAAAAFDPGMPFYRDGRVDQTSAPQHVSQRRQGVRIFAHDDGSNPITRCYYTLRNLHQGGNLEDVPPELHPSL